MTQAQQYFKDQHELANKLHKGKNRGVLNLRKFGFNNYEITGIKIGISRNTRPKQNGRRKSNRGTNNSIVNECSK